MTEWLHIDGIRLEALRIAPKRKQAPMLVFLHEGLGSVSLWRDFPDVVAEASGCGAFLYSRRGYGRSDPMPLPRPKSYLHDEARAVLPKVLAAAGIEPHILIGHSDGASIALIAAGDAVPPCSLLGVVAMAPHLVAEEITLAGIREAVKAYERGPLRDRLARHHLANVDNAFRGWEGAWLRPDFRNWSMEDSLTSIRIPVLALQGKQDEYGTPRQVLDIQARSPSPVEICLLDDCAHIPYRDKRDETLAAITAFIYRIETSSRVPPSPVKRTSPSI